MVVQHPERAGFPEARSGIGLCRWSHERWGADAGHIHDGVGTCAQSTEGDGARVCHSDTGGSAGRAGKAQGEKGVGHCEALYR